MLPEPSDSDVAKPTKLINICISMYSNSKLLIKTFKLVNIKQHNMHYAAAHDKKNDSHLMTFEYILGVLELAVVEATIDPYKYIQCANIISIMSSSRTSKSNTQAAKINSSNNNIQVAKINSNSNRQA